MTISDHNQTQMNHYSIKILLLFFALYTNFHLTAQSHWNTRPNNTIDLIAGVDLGFRLIAEDALNPELATQIYNRERLEQHKINYRFGINYYQGVGKNLCLKLGARWSNPGFRISEVAAFDVREDINLIEKEVLFQGMHYYYNYQLIELLLGLRYIATQATCKPYFEVGIAPNFYLNTLVQEAESLEETSVSIQIQEAITPISFIGFLLLVVMFF